MKLNYNNLLSSFAFNFKLRRYTKGLSTEKKAGLDVISGWDIVSAEAVERSYSDIDWIELAGSDGPLFDRLAGMAAASAKVNVSFDLEHEEVSEVRNT